MDGLFLIYKPRTGRIYQVMAGPNTERRREQIDSTVDSINMGLSHARRVQPVFYAGRNIKADTHYVEHGEPMLKKAFPPIGVGNGTLYNLPMDTMVYWPDGETSVPDDGTVEFDSNVALSLELSLYHAKYVDHVVEVEYAI